MSQFGTEIVLVTGPRDPWTRGGWRGEGEGLSPEERHGISGDGRTGGVSETNAVRDGPHEKRGRRVPIRDGTRPRDG